MLNHICALGDTSVIHGCMIHSPHFQNSNTTTKFWQVQAAIILNLRLIRLLSIIVDTVHPEHDGRSVKTFSTNLKSKDWILSSMDVHYPDLGDTIAGGCCIITAVHSPCASNVKPLQLKQPPQIPPHLWVNSYGSHSTRKSIQSCWLKMTKTLPSKTWAYKPRPQPLHPTGKLAF